MSPSELPIEIRRVTTDADAWACAGIMASTDPWLRYGRTREANFATITMPGAESYVAVTPDGAVAGVVAVALAVPLIKGYVMALAVRDDCRNRGIGRRLLEHAEQRIFELSPNVFLCVTSFNAGAKWLYERVGYVEVGLIRNYVHDGVDEHLMRKTRGPWSTFTAK